MTARIYYEVVPAPDPDSGWNVTRDGHTVGWEPTKEEAVDVATDAARTEAVEGQPTSVRIKKLDGRIQEERTYPRSSDPRRYPG